MGDDIFFIPSLSPPDSFPFSPFYIADIYNKIFFTIYLYNHIMLKNKTALITGASRGIGKGIALKFAENGAYIGLNYNENDKAAQDTLKEIRKIGSDGLLLKGNISDENEVNNIVEKLVLKRNNIDIIVNNAGIYPRNSFKDLTKQDWDKTLSVNLTGCFNICKKSIDFMKSKGKIIFISSQLAFKGTTHGAGYTASKAGILGLMKSLALEFSDRKINVNAVAPGTIDTDILSEYTDDMRRKRIEEIPLKRLGTPEDIANCCLFLASDLSSYITGETINVNGGLYIH